ncbi:MAG: DUF882 domain-containing protein, partial [Gammaproteobacteria bacterium]
MKSRRHFLKAAIGATVSLVSPTTFAGIVKPNERILKFYNLHTGEKLKATYWADGDYINEELTAINHLLRDHRTGDVKPIDQQLLDLLYVLQNKVEKNNAYHIISGYRSPRTNTLLRRNSNGVAKRSMHLLGKAVDVRLPGVEL